MDNHRDPTFYNILLSSEIRFCIFLITSVCVGLPALVWAFCLLQLHRKIRGRISGFIILLLLSDLIQLLLNLCIVIQLLTKSHWISELFQFWSGLHWCGFQLHQLVTLERVLTLKYPLWSARFCSQPCYIIMSILVLAFFIRSMFILFMHPIVNMPILLFNIGTGLAYLSLLAVTFTITCKDSSSSVSKKTCSVFTVGIVNFVMLYLPFMLVICVNLFIKGRVHPSWYVMSVCLMSLRVISDPLLCVLVCKGNLRDYRTPQANTEPRANVTSV